MVSNTGKVVAVGAGVGLAGLLIYLATRSGGISIGTHTLQFKVSDCNTLKYKYGGAGSPNVYVILWQGEVQKFYEVMNPKTCVCTIKGVPTGKYTIGAMTSDSQILCRTAEINVTADLNFEISPLSRFPAECLQVTNLSPQIPIPTTNVNFDLVNLPPPPAGSDPGPPGLRVTGVQLDVNIKSPEGYYTPVDAKAMTKTGLDWTTLMLLNPGTYQVRATIYGPPTIPYTNPRGYIQLKWTVTIPSDIGLSLNKKVTYQASRIGLDALNPDEGAIPKIFLPA